jgi:putative serine protease PepD
MTDEQREPSRHADPHREINEPARVPAFAGASAQGRSGTDSTAHPNTGWLGADRYGLLGGGPIPPPGNLPPVPSAPQPRRPRRTMAGIVAVALVGGLVGGAGGFGAAYALSDRDSGGSLTLAPSSGASAAPAGSVAAAAATALPSTVDIQVPMAGGSAEGSGVVLTADGNVLTNNHVVAGASGPITVTLADGSRHQATVVGTSPSYDLAVIKLQGVSGLTPATMGSSASLQVGQEVVAIGSPQGLSGTVTSGIVSALDRTVAVQAENGTAVVYNGLQTDAPINPGNSGGPLVDLQGRVIGIDSAIATSGSQGGSIGLGFAIPVDQATRIAQELMSAGTATKPVLGVEGSTAGAGRSGQGATIAAVVPGSPAAQAGLVAGDVVTAVDGTPVEDFADLIARIGAHAPGDQVSMTVGQGSATRQVTATLGSTPDTAATTTRTTPFGN